VVAAVLALHGPIPFSLAQQSRDAWDEGVQREAALARAIGVAHLRPGETHEVAAERAGIAAGAALDRESKSQRFPLPGAPVDGDQYAAYLVDQIEVEWIDPRDGSDGERLVAVSLVVRWADPRQATGGQAEPRGRSRAPGRAELALARIPAVGPASAAHSGVVVDTPGLELAPRLFFEICGTAEQRCWRPDAGAVAAGSHGWADGLDSARTRVRVGSRPVHLHLVRLEPGPPTRIWVDDGGLDGEHRRRLGQLIAQGRLVIMP